MRNFFLSYFLPHITSQNFRSTFARMSTDKSSAVSSTVAPIDAANGWLSSKDKEEALPLPLQSQSSRCSHLKHTKSFNATMTKVRKSGGGINSQKMTTVEIRCVGYGSDNLPMIMLDTGVWNCFLDALLDKNTNLKPVALEPYRDAARKNHDLPGGWHRDLFIWLAQQWEEKWFRRNNKI